MIECSHRSNSVSVDHLHSYGSFTVFLPSFVYLLMHINPLHRHSHPRLSRLPPCLCTSLPLPRSSRLFITTTLSRSMTYIPKFVYLLLHPTLFPIPCKGRSHPECLLSRSPPCLGQWPTSLTLLNTYAPTLFPNSCKGHLHPECLLSRSPPCLGQWPTSLTLFIYLCTQSLPYPLQRAFTPRMFIIMSPPCLVCLFSHANYPPCVYI
jgi:hypothetical protein